MAGERLQPSVIFAVTFVMIAAFIISMLPALFNANAVSNHIKTGYDAIGGVEYTMFTPDSTDTGGTIGSFNVSGHYVQEYNNDTVTGGPFHSDWRIAMDPDLDTDEYVSLDDIVHLSFYDTKADPITHHRIDVFIVRNWTYYYLGAPSDPGDPTQSWVKYRDFFFIREYKWDGSWFNPAGPNSYTVLSFDSVAANVDASKGTSETYFMAKSNLSLFIKYTSNVKNYYSDLTSNHFVIGVGSWWGNDQVARTSMWSMLGQLLTLSLPEVDPIVNVIMAIPFWIAITFTAVTVISRFIPFISGG